MNRKKSGFISTALVYTFLVIFLFLMLAILRTYIEKDNFLEAINSQIDNDINKDIENRRYALTQILEDNTPQSVEKIKLFKPASSSLGNGNGLFYLDNDELTDENNDKETDKIYFFRGSVENNHVIYKDMCFRIVRTNEDGSIRMIYDGKSNSNRCYDLSSKPNVNAGTINFSDAETVSLIDIQYGVTPEYDERFSHSKILDVLNEWYRSNIINSTIEPNQTRNIHKGLVFCNNRKVISTESNIKYYESKNLQPKFKGSDTNRLDDNNVTNSLTLVCSEQNDQLSVDTRTIAYPVGVLTAEEVVLAGGYLSSSDDTYQGGKEGMINNKYYLYTGRNFWTSSPYRTNQSNNHNYVIYVNSNGFMQPGHVTESYDVIPVISLSPTSRFISGNGTSNNPYILE